MVVLPTLVVFCLTFHLIPGHKITDDGGNPIVFPEDYHFKGDKFNMLTGLQESFEIWRHSNLNRTRFDVYGGSSKSYYYGDTEHLYWVYPTADEHLVSHSVCLFRIISVPKEQTELVDLSGLIYSGQNVQVLGKLVDLWIGKGEQDGLIWEKHLFVQKIDNNYDIPVQYINRVYDEESGVVEELTVRNFYDFKSSVESDEVTIPNDLTCKKMPKRWPFAEAIQALHPDAPGHLDVAFETYVQHHSKQYQKNERHMRKESFRRNWRMVLEHNSKNASYKMELNEFSDQDLGELKFLPCIDLAAEPPTSKQSLEAISEDDDDLPQELDLRNEGFVTKVKSQGPCGSCWAFAITAAIESAMARNNGGELVDLSEQALIDCAWAYHTSGCNGARSLEGAWSFVVDHGIPTEGEYGDYTAHNGYCAMNNMSTIYKIKGFGVIPPDSPVTLKRVLQTYGPVTVAVHADAAMLHYSHGVFENDKCGPNARLNHVMTVIGYGIRDGQQYWIVKNSWGEQWGNDGVILMAAEHLSLDYAYYAIV